MKDRAAAWVRYAGQYALGVAGLGLDADWFPDGNYVLTTDGVKLITVTVAWPGSSQAARRALSIAVARRFLGRLHHNPNAGY